jgi:hypothetical protein
VAIHAAIAALDVQEAGPDTMYFAAFPRCDKEDVSTAHFVVTGTEAKKAAVYATNPGVAAGLPPSTTINGTRVSGSQRDAVKLGVRSVFGESAFVGVSQIGSSGRVGRPEPSSPAVCGGLGQIVWVKGRSSGAKAGCDCVRCA